MSTALSRGSVRFRTDNLTLMSPVMITIHHSEIVEVSTLLHKVFSTSTVQGSIGLGQSYVLIVCKFYITPLWSLYSHLIPSLAGVMNT